MFQCKQARVASALQTEAPSSIAHSIEERLTSTSYKHKSTYPGYERGSEAIPPYGFPSARRRSDVGSSSGYDQLD